MNEPITLLDNEYSCESLCDLERDVSEMLQFPKDKKYLEVKPDEDGFTSGTYKVLVVYVP